MTEPLPKRLRDYLAKEAPKLAVALNALWQYSEPLHERQNRPDSNENGRKHVEQVEKNIWRLLTETRDKDGKLNLENITPNEIFLLSAAACCHDFDKALKSDLPSLPGKFVHGKDSADFIKKQQNFVALGIDKHQADDIAAVIGIHDLKASPFKNELPGLSGNQLTSDGSINLRRVAVLLKAADILHCDSSRVQKTGIDLEKLAEDKDKEKRERELSKYIARECTRGWVADGTRIRIQATPDDTQKLAAFSAAFQFMKTEEWMSVADALEHLGFPHRFALHDDTAKVVKPLDIDDAQAKPTPHLTGPGDSLPNYPEPQSKWVGRVVELAELQTAWSARTRLYTIVGFGGEGKTALGHKFTESLRRAADQQDRPLVVWWSFYFNKAADAFFDAVLTHFKISLTEEGRSLQSEQKARKLVDLLRTGVNGRRLLLVLDGLETVQDDTVGREGRVTDSGLRELLRGVLDDAEADSDARGMILITTREALAGFRRENDARYGEITLEQLSVPDGAALLTQQYKLKIEQDDAERFVMEVGGHALTLTLTGALHAALGGTTNLADLRQYVVSEEAMVTDPALTTRRKRFHRLPGYVLRHCADALNEQERQFLRLLSCCCYVRPASRPDIEEVFLQPLKSETDGEPFNDQLVGLDYVSLRTRVIARLMKLRLIHGGKMDDHAEDAAEETGYDMHPLVRRHFYEDDHDAALTEPRRKAVHSRFYDVLPARQEKRYPDTMDEMRPLLDAVQHGCRAGRAQAALAECYYTRISRKDQPGRTTLYLSSNLGAVETELALLRGFFPDGKFAGDPMVTREDAKAFLINAAALLLMNTGRPALTIPLFQRALSACLAQPESDWANANTACQNLCESHMLLGKLPSAAEAASNALDYAGRMPNWHKFKNTYTIFSHGHAATIAALRGNDEAASDHFAAAIRLDPDDWLGSLPGYWHCTWLARLDKFDQARSAGQKNDAWCQENSGLHDQTFALATQGLIERLAWAAGDPGRAGLHVMAGYALRAVETGRRSGDHFFLTYALLEAGRCAVARARHDSPNRAARVAEGLRYLDEAEQRAVDAGYRLIRADLHVARAELAGLAGDTAELRRHCDAAHAICDAADCGYAWAREDARVLLDQ